MDESLVLLVKIIGGFFACALIWAILTKGGGSRW